MKEYNKPIVATIISVLRSLIVSKTNHTTNSTSNPPISRMRKTLKLIIICPAGFRAALFCSCLYADESPRDAMLGARAVSAGPTVWRAA
jgi:hypothetical protein